MRAYPLGRIALIAALAVIAVPLAYVATAGLGGQPPAGSTAPSGGAPRIGIEVGDAAPDFVDAAGRPLLTGWDGEPISLRDYEGRPLWIVFWTTWCTPCQEESGAIQAAYHEHADAKLAVLAVDVLEPTDASRTFATAHGLDYDIGLDPTAAVRDRYGGWGLPIHYFLGGDEVIRDRYIGQLTPELMQERLAAILPGG